MTHDCLLGKFLSVPGDVHPHGHAAHCIITAALDFPWVLVRELAFDERDDEPPISFLLDVTKPSVMFFDTIDESQAWHEWIAALPADKLRNPPPDKVLQ